jgi:hypothetical protein
VIAATSLHGPAPAMTTGSFGVIIQEFGCYLGQHNNKSILILLATKPQHSSQVLKDIHVG